MAEPAEPPGDLAAWLMLTRTPGLTHEMVLALLGQFGMPEEVLAQPRSALSRVIGPELARSLKEETSSSLGEIVAATDRWLGSAGRHVLSLADLDYPPQLLHQDVAPPLLFIDGKPSSLKQPWLAMIAPRAASEEAIATGLAFTRALLEARIALLLPFGTAFSFAVLTEALRHSGARIAAVLEHSPERISPANHVQLARQVAASGTLISALAPGEPVAKSEGQAPQTPQTLLAALPVAVLVFEAGLHSREYQTARLAGTLGRDVFAIPGSIHAPLARGCHRLIRDGARLMERVEDILEECGEKLRERVLTS